MDATSTEKKLVRVTIFQQPYTLRSSDEPGETEALAEAVDALMNQIATRSPSMDSTRVAVLASLHLADQVRQLELAYNQLCSRIDAAEARLANVLDATKK